MMFHTVWFLVSLYFPKPINKPGLMFLLNQVDNREIIIRLFARIIIDVLKENRIG